jgi:RNA-directed DNA polymerase
LAKSLKTPLRVRKLQRKLYAKAKRESACRFHQLYDKVYRGDILLHAYELCRANRGAPGVDGESFADIEKSGRIQWLAELQRELREKTYCREAVRRVMIKKIGGGERPLGIPTIRDRVVQQAVKLVIEPIFEADFDDSAHGYRPKRSARKAIEQVHQGLREGYTEVVDADLSKYFDTIPHPELMKCVARRIADRMILKLLKDWLKAPVEVTDERGRKRITGGRSSTQGTPQGGVISPLLANLYMHRYLKAFRREGKDREYRARIVNYADDFVILTRGHAAEALEWTRWVMERIGLSLNETKTCLRDGRREEFNFLGYTFGPTMNKHLGKWYLGAHPSDKSLKRIKDRIHEILTPKNTAPWPEVVVELTQTLRGWVNYFSYGAVRDAYRALEQHLEERVRHFLRRRSKVIGQGFGRFNSRVIFGELGVPRLSALAKSPA